MTRRAIHRHVNAAVAWVAAACAAAHGQQATHTPAATQPAAGNFSFRQRLIYTGFGDDPSPQRREVDKLTAISTLTYGLERDMSVSLELPAAYQSVQGPGSGADRELGVNDFSLTFQYRPFQVDLNPIDSKRLAVFAGVEFPSTDADFSSHSFDPFVGAVFTTILGRHGFNQSVSWKFNTGGDAFSLRPGDGPDDALRYDTAYLFRLAPERYEADTVAATYLTLELNGLYETSGDNEILFGPGILYEARDFALELMMGLPIVQDVEHRPEVDVMIAVGFRLLF